MLNMLKNRTLLVLASLLILGACSYKPQQSADSNATGSSSDSSETSNTSGEVSALGDITPGSSQDFIANVGDSIFFDYDSSELSDEAQATLRAQAVWLNQFPNVSITIEGHADERGTREYNLALGARRAVAAQNYLESFGISPDRVLTISYGKERPIALGENAAAWAQNRRAVTVLQGL